MNRIALYFGDGRPKPDRAALHFYFQGAHTNNLRIVTVKREAATGRLGRRPVLKRLVARMDAGEFEAIVLVGENGVESSTVSGSVPYGYRKVRTLDAKGEPINGIREIDPEKAAIVRRIHADFDAGKTTFEISAALNKEGVPSPKDKLWRPGTLLGNRHGGTADSR